MNSDLAGLEHADTFPPTSSSTDQFSRPQTDDSRPAPEPSTRSFEPINPDGTKPRKRKTFLGGFGDHAEIDETASSSNVDKPVEKHKFTFMGQLKATVFNSWINILILAAPAGSECRVSHVSVETSVLMSIVALYYVNANPVAIFVVNFIAIMYGEPI